MADNPFVHLAALRELPGKPPQLEAALESCALDLKSPGEEVAFFGENGHGKSTLLNYNTVMTLDEEEVYRETIGTSVMQKCLPLEAEELEEVHTSSLYEQDEENKGWLLPQIRHQDFLPPPQTDVNDLRKNLKQAREGKTNIKYGLLQTGNPTGSTTADLFYLHYALSSMLSRCSMMSKLSSHWFSISRLL
uniref:ABC transporter domain-containing protein n=1 Tax=Paramoeba aestuarina TaxID=180227 RepID=A0A7S4JPT7_9EUKA|mmetsp:Transcript_12147/g.18538  ORF Transcript_12147/g.18538 Transcript_12147/m.18538 type:complete len:191 (+) Transcript_12147:89-661(+)